MTESMNARIGNGIKTILVAGVIAIVRAMWKTSTDVATLASDQAHAVEGQRHLADTIHDMSTKMDKVSDMGADLRGMRVELEDHDRRLNALEQQRQLQRWSK